LIEPAAVRRMRAPGDEVPDGFARGDLPRVYAVTSHTVAEREGL